MFLVSVENRKRGSAISYEPGCRLRRLLRLAFLQQLPVFFPALLRRSVWTERSLCIRHVENGFALYIKFISEQN